jgi:uncharacterized membrane protein YfcA
MLPNFPPLVVAEQFGLLASMAPGPHRSMILVGILMPRDPRNPGTIGARCTLRKSPKVLGYSLGTGIFSGFFGIGGGFLVVPGLVASIGMPMLNAIGSLLVAVTAFGLTTAFNYALSGLVDWPLTCVFIIGGLCGGLIGTRIAKRLSGTTGTLSVVFAGMIFVVAACMLWKIINAV